MFFLIPQAPGARSARLATRHSARGAVAPSGLLRSPAPVMADALPVAGREVNHFPRRRARAPLACLRAMRRGTRSRAPHHGAVEGGCSARQHRFMQNETRQTTTAAAFGRSSIARLPPTLREAVDAAIADGATIDEITARIRGGGRRVLALGRRPLRQEHARPDPPAAGGRPRQRGVGACARRAYSRASAGLILIETLRTLVLSTLADLSGREEPVSTAELARLALVLRRIEGTDKLRLERERAVAKAAAKAAPGAGQAPVRKGLSPEAVAAIREVVEGRPRRPARAVTSAPVDPWNPSDSHLSQLIPLNPGESRPENVSPLSRPGPTPFESLGPDTRTLKPTSRSPPP